jgi:hypothetical protein
VTRSLLRDVVECASTVAANASLKDIHYSPGIGNFLSYFPGELERLLGSFDSARLASDLRLGTPRDWRTLLEIALAFGEFGEAFLRDIIDRLNIDSIVANTETLIEHYGHQIRPFIWLLSYGSEDGRRRLAPRLAALIERILLALPAEREQLLEAFVALDGNVGGQLASRFGVQVGTFAIDRKLEDLERLIAAIRAAFDEADRSGTDYDVLELLSKLLNRPGKDESREG